MLNIDAFEKCIRDNLKDKRYGKERADEIIADFKARTEVHMRAGRPEVDAATMAMRDTFDAITENAIEKAKRTSKMLAVQASNADRIAQGLDVDLKVLDAGRAKGSKKTNRGQALVRAAISLIEHDPRFKGGDYSTSKDIVRGQLFSLFADSLDKFGKGTFGVQRGKAHLPNVVKEIFRDGSTGDRSAQEFAHAWLKVSDLGVDLFNQAGGTLKKLNKYVPQRLNAAKLHEIGEDGFIDLYMSAVDWGKTRWPDGTEIAPANREYICREAYQTFTTDGAHKLDTTAFRGAGRAVGNLMDNHRFFHFKDADSWIKVHDAVGDGTIFDVFVNHMENMSHKIALVDTFGPNPEATIQNIKAQVKKAAAKLSPKDKVAADELIKNKFEPMMEIVTRANPLDPNSTLGALVTGTSNILTAAQLGSASLLAIPGDFMQTAAVRAFNNQRMFGGMDFYFKAMATEPALMKQIASQSGFIMDDAIKATYATTRFSGVATVAPAVSRRISDTIMRASLMSGHTRSARWSVQAEYMGLLNRSRKTAYDDLPFVDVFRRYGITKEDWDAVRNNVGEWTPAKGVAFLRPNDILNAKGIKNKQELFKKFQGMVLREAKTMVPESTIEASVTLKNTSRPDTLAGLLLHSFAMYKNFPVSFWMIYGRLGMTSGSVKGRLSFYAGLGAGMTMVGALGTQMREISQGRDPMPMDTPKFWGKAFLSGGALSIWGDFLFGGVNRMGSSPTETAAGPLFGFAGDSTQLLFGDIFQWANTVGSLDENFESKTPAKLVEYLKRYTPGTNIWWARLALERQAWERLQELADPKAYSKWQRKARNQMKQYGNGYWWPQGDKTPERLPQYKGKK